MTYDTTVELRVGTHCVETVRDAAQMHNTTQAAVWRSLLSALPTQQPLSELFIPTDNARAKVLVRCSNAQRKRYLIAKAQNDCTAAVLFESVLSAEAVK